MNAHKLLIILLCCLYLSDSIAQSRRTIINSIREVKIEALNNAKYITGKEDMRSNLKLYFKSIDYKLEAEEDSFIQFSTNVTYVAERRRQIPYHRESRTIGPNYRRYSSKAYVDISIIDLGEAIQLEIYPNLDKRQFSYRNPNPYRAVFKFQEFRLREHLFISYIGYELPMPEDLMVCITSFNGEQTNYRKKILPGRDY